MSLDNRANILLVDDQPAKLLSYEAILSDLGENLISASSAEEALDHLLRNDVAVVLVDVCMPGLDGFELAGMIREHPRFQKTPIIFVSAVNLSEFDRLKGYESGAVDYVPVPVAPEILRAKVRVFAELHRKTQELAELNLKLEQRVAERTAALEASTARLRDSEERLQETARRKDEFLAMLAHELRNPLAPIRAAVQLMRLKGLKHVQRAKARDVIERQVEHLVRLIDDLLDVSRITRGTITLQCEPVNLADVMGRAVEASRSLIDARGHELTVELPQDPLNVNGDLTRLTQVVGNILDNAVKFTNEKGRIEVRVEQDGGDAVVRVKDTGIGIPPEMLSKIFDLFMQVEGPLVRGQGGLGIGLALVQQLVDMHGGSVKAYSHGVGSGTEVVVRLPILKSSSQSPRQSMTDDNRTCEAPGMTTRRVLVVDDNKDAADLITLMIELEGYDVRTTYDSTEALGLGARFTPDVVLLDLGMPNLDGYEIARQIRNQPWGKTVVLIALTGWGREEDRSRTAQAGFNTHLVKPVDQALLLKVLGNLGHPEAGALGDARHGRPLEGGDHVGSGIIKGRAGRYPSGRA